MKLLIDDANVQKIKEISEFFPVDGVTTNPSILAKSGRPPFEVLAEIRAFLGDFLQTFAKRGGNVTLSVDLNPA